MRVNKRCISFVTEKCTNKGQLRIIIIFVNLQNYMFNIPKFVYVIDPPLIPTPLKIVEAAGSTATVTCCWVLSQFRKLFKASTKPLA